MDCNTKTLNDWTSEFLTKTKKKVDINVEFRIGTASFYLLLYTLPVLKLWNLKTRWQYDHGLSDFYLLHRIYPNTVVVYMTVQLDVGWHTSKDIILLSYFLLHKTTNYLVFLHVFNSLCSKFFGTLSWLLSLRAKLGFQPSEGWSWLHRRFEFDVPCALFSPEMYTAMPTQVTVGTLYHYNLISPF